jgi:uncharacterized repeat protein (TIGR01451 family)
VSAQEPQDDHQSSLLVSEETLTAFGLSADLIQSLSVLTSDLEITKKTDVFSVTSGSLVTFTISITNHGPDPISYMIFYDDFPSEMKDVALDFSLEHDPLPFPPTAEKPEWLFHDPVLVDETVFVTVTGILTSPVDVTVKNTAVITSVGNYDQKLSNNVSAATVKIDNHNPPPPTNPSTVYYFPIIYKAPPEVLVYSDNFSNSGSGWYKGYSNDDDCYSYYHSGRYRININDDYQSCWRPAPSAASRVYGSFQIDAYHSDGDSNATFGIYINGQGGKVYYLFRIWPNHNCTNNGGGWELLRNGSRVLGNSGACHSAIKRGYGYDNRTTLKIKHTKDGKISVYGNNNTLLGTYQDNAQLTGSGVGVYARSSNKNIVVKFDDFKVFTVP